MINNLCVIYRLFHKCKCMIICRLWYLMQWHFILFTQDVARPDCLTETSVWFATDVRSCRTMAEAEMIWLSSSVDYLFLTHSRKLVLGGLSEISSALRVDWGLLRSSEQERSIESENESVSSTKMEIGTDRLR